MATGQLSPKPGGMQGIRLALARLARYLPAWLRHRTRHCRRRHARDGEMKLISTTPSPYAQRVRIALAEKGIAFELQTEVAWNEGTSLPQHNPLEKLPVLILDDGLTVWESGHILEWIERKHSQPPLLPPCC